jgi:hypothetical protein
MTTEIEDIKCKREKEWSKDKKKMKTDGKKVMWLSWTTGINLRLAYTQETCGELRNRLHIKRKTYMRKSKSEREIRKEDKDAKPTKELWNDCSKWRERKNTKISWHKDTSIGAVTVNRGTVSRGYNLAQAHMSDYTTGGQLHFHEVK